MRLGQLVAIVELRTKVVSLSTFALGVLYALWAGGPGGAAGAAGAAEGTIAGAGAGSRAGDLVLCLLATLLVDMGTTAFNSFFDWYRGGDRPESNLETDKVLVHEKAPALPALLLGLGLYALAAVLGLILALHQGFWIVLAGGLSLFMGFFYSAGPWPLSHSPVGELVAGGFLGSVLFLIVVGVAGGSWDGPAVLASLPGAALIAGILGVNNACDREADRQAGRKTFAVLAGPGPGRAYVLFWLTAGFLGAGALMVAHNLPWTCAAGLGLALVPALVEALRMGRRGFGAGTKSANMGAVVRILLLWSLGMAAGLGAAVALGI